MLLKKCAITAAALFMAAGLGLGSANAAIELKFSDGANEGTPFADAAYAMAEFINTQSNGKYHMTVYPFYKLGNPSTSMQGLQIGSIHFYHDGSSQMTNFTPAIGVFDLPYVFSSKKEADYALHGPNHQKLLDMLSTKSITYLSIADSNFRVMLTSKPAANLDEMRKLKIRTTNSKVHTEAIKMMGFGATPMPGSEVFTAIQQGVVDGCDIDYPYAVITNWTEITHYAFESFHMYTPQPLVTGAKWWKSIPAEDKLLFEQAVKLWEAKVAEGITKWSTEAKAKVVALGHVITTPDAAELQRWIDAAQPTHSLMNDAQKAFYAEIVAELKAGGLRK